MASKEADIYAPWNFSWVVPDKIAGMAWPQTKANIRFLLMEGINHLITLSPEKRPPMLEFPEMKWTVIPIGEFEAPTIKQILKFIDVCQRAEIKGEVLGVHCRQGRGRTGTILACYLVHFKNLAPERAVLTVRVQRPGSCETYEQEKIVCRYHDCLRGTLKVDYRVADNKEAFDEVYQREDETTVTQDTQDTMSQITDFETETCDYSNQSSL